MLCVRCSGFKPPGCDLRAKGARLFGWSDSNCQYEDIGANRTVTLID